MKGNNKISSKEWLFLHILYSLCLLKPVFSQMNVALQKPTSQSHTVIDQYSKLAVDGDISIKYEDCSRADPDRNGRWWMVDLEGSYIIGLVRLTVRQEDDLNATILVAKALNERTSTLQDPEICKHVTQDFDYDSTVSFKCDKIIEGQYVRIENGFYQGPLALCEVKVFPGNLARGKTAGQSSTALDHSAARAVDGNANKDMRQGSCSQTHSNIVNAYWYVNLEDTYMVQMVKITMRDDCTTCDTDLSSATIYVTHADKHDPTPVSYVSSEKCSDIQALNAGGTTDIYCDIPVNGRYVYIQNNGSIRGAMSLCEVQVYGPKATEGRTSVIMPVISSPKSAQTTLHTNPGTSTDRMDVSGLSSMPTLRKTSASTHNSSTVLIYAVTSALVTLGVILVVLLVFIIYRRRSRKDQESTTRSNNKHTKDDITTEEDIEPDYSTVNRPEMPPVESSTRQMENIDRHAEPLDNVANLYATVNKEKHKGQPNKTGTSKADTAALYAVPDKRQKTDKPGSKALIEIKNKKDNKPIPPPNKPRTLSPTVTNVTDEQKLTMPTVHDSNVEYAQVNKKSKNLAKGSTVPEPPEYAVVNKTKKTQKGFEAEDVYNEIELQGQPRTFQTNENHEAPGEDLYNDTQLKEDTDTEYYNIIPAKCSPTNDTDPDVNVYANA